MTVVARSVRATPYRSASEAWEQVVSLLAPDGGPAREELLRVEGIASTLIASEAPQDDPIVAYGAGPRVRVYCLYDEEALTGDRANEQRLPESPTEGDWRLSFPCLQEDLPWVRDALAKNSTRVTARALGEPVDSDTERGDIVDASEVTIDAKAFLRP